MKNTKKISLILALALGITPILSSVNQSKSYANEYQKNENVKKEKLTLEKFINYVDSNIIVNENNLYEIQNKTNIIEYINNNIEQISLIFNTKTTKETFEKIEKRINDLNNLSKNKKIVILKNKRIYDKSITFRSINHSNIGELSKFWWGTRRTFTSSGQAYNFATKLQQDIAVIDMITLIFGAAVATEAVIGFITTLYLNDLSNAVNKWADNHPYGFKLDISWVGYYTLKE